LLKQHFEAQDVH
jgi:hypothetical protein